jgi:hypothetical protein
MPGLAGVRRSQPGRPITPLVEGLRKDKTGPTATAARAKPCTAIARVPTLALRRCSKPARRVPRAFQQSRHAPARLINMRRGYHAHLSSTSHKEVLCECTGC